MAPEIETRCPLKGLTKKMHLQGLLKKTELTAPHMQKWTKLCLLSTHPIKLMRVCSDTSNPLQSSLSCILSLTQGLLCTFQESWRRFATDLVRHTDSCSIKEGTHHQSWRPWTQTTEHLHLCYIQNHTINSCYSIVLQWETFADCLLYRILSFIKL